MELGYLHTCSIYRERLCVGVFVTESVFDGSSTKTYFTTKPHKDEGTKATQSLNKRLKNDQTKAKESWNKERNRENKGQTKTGTKANRVKEKSEQKLKPHHAHIRAHRIHTAAHAHSSIPPPRSQHPHSKPPPHQGSSLTTLCTRATPLHTTRLLISQNGHEPTMLETWRDMLTPSHNVKMH